MKLQRTHHCAQLTKADLGASVSLLGWVDSIRDHGGILFIDLRDRKGITQVKFDPQSNPALAAQAATLKPSPSSASMARSLPALKAPSTPPSPPARSKSMPPRSPSTTSPTPRPSRSTTPRPTRSTKTCA